jgi:hypothetical protein
METYFLQKRTAKEKSLYGNHGIYANVCNVESLKKAMLSVKSNLPIIQVGHWCATFDPPKEACLFANPLLGMDRLHYDTNIANRNFDSKNVVFTDLVPNSCQNIIEYACLENFSKPWDSVCGWRNVFVYTDIVTISKDHADLFQWYPAIENTWYSCEKYIFRLKAFHGPAAVVIHKSLPKLPENYIQQFENGQSDCWTHNDIDTFVPACRAEEKRAPVQLSEHQKLFLQGNLYSATESKANLASTKSKANLASTKSASTEYKTESSATESKPFKVLFKLRPRISIESLLPVCQELLV